MTFAIELNASQSRRILECACRARHSVRLHPKPWNESPPIECELVECDDEALELEAPRLSSADFKTLLNIYCQVELELQDGQYFFDSHIVAVRDRGDRVGLMLARPDHILVKQRRRSSRLALAKSSSVQLSRHRGERLESFEGQLYNLSEDGLAFQLSAHDAEKMEDGQTWCACFELPEQDHCYKLEGTVCRSLPSASRDCVIIGIQFDLATVDRRELNSLREFLTNRLHGMVAVGGAP